MDYTTFELTKVQAEIVMEAVEYALEMEGYFGIDRTDEDDARAKALREAFNAMMVQARP